MTASEVNYENYYWNIITGICNMWSPCI